MTQPLDPSPTDDYRETSPQAGEHPPTSTPSADDVRQIMRDQNVKLGLGALIVLAFLAVTIWITASARASSQDSANATNIQLASQGRSACITERRNEQADALGRISINANEAEKAALVDGDEAAAAEFLRLFEEAVDDWQVATDSLAPAVLNAPPEDGGCGPPILNQADLAEATTTSTEAP